MLCDEDMKYSGRGRVISCHVSLCWSAKTELSGERRKVVNPSIVISVMECSSEGSIEVDDLAYLLNILNSSEDVSVDCE